MASLFYFEWKKSYGRRVTILTILLFTVLNFANIFYDFQSNSWFADSPGWQKAYWGLYDRFSGAITQEHLDALRELYEPLAKKSADLTFNRADDPNSLTGINEYSDYLMLERFYVKPMQNFLGYKQQAQKIAQNARENGSFYDHIRNSYEYRKNAKINNLFENRKISSFGYTEVWDRLSNYTFSSWLILLICLFASSNAFAQEKGTRMELLLQTTPSGKKRTSIAKCLSSIVFTVLVTLWFCVSDWIGFAWSYKTISGCTMPIYALADFVSSPLQCSLGIYFILCAGLRILGVLFFAFVCCGISSMFSNALYPFLFGGMIAFGSSVAANATKNLYDPYWRAFNPASLLFPKSLFSSTEYVSCWGEPILTPLITVILAVSGSMLIIVLLCRKGKL